MSDAWLEQLARTQGADPLSEAESESLLGVARDVAHRVERKATPLATFLLGMAAQRRIDEGSTRDEAFGAALSELHALLPEGEQAG